MTTYNKTIVTNPFNYISGRLINVTALETSFETCEWEWCRDIRMTGTFSQTTFIMKFSFTTFLFILFSHSTNVIRNEFYDFFAVQCALWIILKITSNDLLTFFSLLFCLSSHKPQVRWQLRRATIEILWHHRRFNFFTERCLRLKRTAMFSQVMEQVPLLY